MEYQIGDIYDFELHRPRIFADMDLAKHDANFVAAKIKPVASRAFLDPQREPQKERWPDGEFVFHKDALTFHALLGNVVDSGVNHGQPNFIDATKAFIAPVIALSRYLADPESRGEMEAEISYFRDKAARDHDHANEIASRIEQRAEAARASLRNKVIKARAVGRLTP